MDTLFSEQFISQPWFYFNRVAICQCYTWKRLKTKRLCHIIEQTAIKEVNQMDQSRRSLICHIYTVLKGYFSASCSIFNMVPWCFYQGMLPKNCVYPEARRSHQLLRQRQQSQRKINHLDKRSNNPSPDVPSSYEAKGEGGEAATPKKTDTSVCWDAGSKGQLQTRCVSRCPTRYSPSLPLCLTWLMHMGELRVPRLICLSAVLHQSLACLEVSRKKTWGS